MTPRELATRRAARLNIPTRQRDWDAAAWDAVRTACHPYDAAEGVAEDAATAAASLRGAAWNRERAAWRATEDGNDRAADANDAAARALHELADEIETMAARAIEAAARDHHKAYIGARNADPRYPARDLQPGDRIHSRDGVAVTVDHIHPAPGAVTVYATTDDVHCGGGALIWRCNPHESFRIQQGAPARRVRPVPLQHQ